jgi:hypothetical protein
VPASEDVEYRRVSTEARLASVAGELMSTLVLVPGHPQFGPFYLTQVGWGHLRHHEYRRGPADVM